MSSDEASDFSHARRLLSEATSICALTGAGVSAESGVPTFRGEEGLWKSYVPRRVGDPSSFQAGSPAGFGSGMGGAGRRSGHANRTLAMKLWRSWPWGPRPSASCYAKRGRAS